MASAGQEELLRVLYSLSSTRRRAEIGKYNGGDIPEIGIETEETSETPASPPPDPRIDDIARAVSRLERIVLRGLVATWTGLGVLLLLEVFRLFR